MRSRFPVSRCQPLHIALVSSAPIWVASRVTSRLMKLTSLIFAAIVAFVISPAVALGLPDAIHVREKVDQEVEFQDKVVAVSYSQTSEGYYLNFGAPFPAQALSVWVSEEVYDRLPGHAAMIGRIVRIKGRIEASSTGPLLKLAAREDFQLLQVDESALTQAVLDGRMDREQFMASVRQKLGAEDFDTLETLAEELRTTRERFGDGTWISFAYYDAFELRSDASEKRLAFLTEKISRWETSRPGSLVALLVRAGLQRDFGWRVRRARLARKLPAEERAKYEQALLDARKLLENHPAAKMYPEYFSIMQTIALCQHWPREQYMRLFEEATAAAPDYYTFYFQAAQYLEPRWFGRKGEWEKFAEEQRQRRGANAAGDALYARIAWSLSHHYDNLFEETAISWEVMASGFDYLIRERPQSRWLKNSYAHFAWQAEDRVRLAKLLPEIREDPDMTVWINLENVGMAERYAAGDR